LGRKLQPQKMVQTWEKWSLVFGQDGSDNRATINLLVAERDSVTGRFKKIV
jgi:hypothetical protein